MRPEFYREAKDAAKCQHLNFGPLARTTESLRPLPVVQQRGPVLLPHELPVPSGMRLTPVTLWPNFPIVSFTCTSPEMVNWAHKVMPPEVKGAVNSLETTLGHCQCCPFWKERQSQ
jgi:hypothetical protein